MFSSFCFAAQRAVWLSPQSGANTSRSGGANSRQAFTFSATISGVTSASASAGAKRRGIDIPSNLVLGVYRNDFAVLMLKASVPSGIEAPLRFYVTENAAGTATLTYREPSAVFRAYGSADLDKMATELDAIWAKVVTGTISK